MGEGEETGTSFEQIFPALWTLIWSRIYISIFSNSNSCIVKEEGKYIDKI